jgi:C4-dicarboxylate transporter, DctM subunit
MANRILTWLRRGEDALALIALLTLAGLPFSQVIVRNIFHSDVRFSYDYQVHLVLIVTFLAGAITSRLQEHLTLAIKIPLREPLGGVIRTLVQILCAAMTVAFAWSALAFALVGFGPGELIGVFPKRLVLLVMTAGYLAMAVRFVLVKPHKKRQLAWLMLALALGSVLAFSSIVQVLTAGAALSTGAVAHWQDLLQHVFSAAAYPLIGLLVLGAFFGAPIYIILGGSAYLLFVHGSLPLAVMPNQAYQMLTGFSIAAIPLFAFTGFLLSENKAGERLVRLFRALFSWFPGGLAVMAILACAFFTTFTGASGVTILALGGLLSYIMIHGGYSRTFTIGLLTASGSIGLLFPPSLPMIIYGVTAQISIKEMFKGGALPGLVLVSAMVIMGITYALRHGVERQHFHLREALTALRESIWEILMPLVIFIGYFGVGLTLVKRFAVLVVFLLAVEALLTRFSGRPHLAATLAVFAPFSAVFFWLAWRPPSWPVLAGAAALAAAYGFLVARSLADPADKPHWDVAAFGRFALLGLGLVLLLDLAVSVTLTLVESAAVAVVYILFVQLVIRRDLTIRELPRVMRKCLPIVGGVLTILSLANGLSYYLIDSDIPMKLTAWVQANVGSKYLFLLLLNLSLIVVGCFLEIYSAILVVAPLVFPLGQIFGINPVHLGIIFLASLELGYLTPPVGLNLLLSSYRFDEPVDRVARDTFKFLLIQLATVLLITYVPILTTALLN